jgi:hypothetical protein
LAASPRPRSPGCGGGGGGRRGWLFLAHRHQLPPSYQCHQPPALPVLNCNSRPQHFHLPLPGPASMPAPRSH